MNHGLYISASGASAAMYRQNVHAGNLSNIETAGFKPLMPMTRQRDAARVEDGLWNLSSNALLERLGGGAQSAPSRVTFKQGALQMTAQPFDLAIRGDGFFVVRVGDGDEGAELRLSRDGRLTRGHNGRLVRAADGLAVLDRAGRPIDLPMNGSLTIEPDGGVRHDGITIAQINLVDVPDRQALTPEEGGMFKFPAETADNLRPASGSLITGALESAAIDEFSVLMEMTGASRAAQSNMGMIEYHDRMMDGAVNRLGRVT